MLENIMKNGKTITGASVMLVVWLLQQAGVQSSGEEVAGVVGALLTIAGLAHKIVKGKKK